MTDPDPSGQGVVGPRGGLEKYKDTPNLRVIGERSEVFLVKCSSGECSGQSLQV